MDETDTKVIEIVSEQMGVDKSEITRETHFINDLNADSLDTVELVMEFEDEFELSIPDEEAEKIQTVGQAIELASQRDELLEGAPGFGGERRHRLLVAGARAHAHGVRRVQLGGVVGADRNGHPALGERR